MQLLEEAKIHNVFHISVLKKFKGDSQGHYLPLPLQIVLEGPMLMPNAILGNRTVMHHGKEVQQLLVQWGHDTTAGTTWEVAEEFHQAYPAFNLEG